MPRPARSEVRRRLEELVKLLSGGGVYTVGQISKMLGLSHAKVSYALRLLSQSGMVDCRIFGARVMLCGAVDKFIGEYIHAVRKALRDLAGTCKLRCCTICHSKILEHPAVLSLLHSLGFSPRITVAQAMSIDIITQYMKLQAYRRRNNAVVFRICRGGSEESEERAEIFAEICKTAANSVGSHVGIRAVEIARALGDMSHATVMRAAVVLKALCKKLNCVKWSKALYYFERNALLQLCASGPPPELLEPPKLMRYEMRKPHSEPLEIVSTHVDPAVLATIDELAQEWGVTRSDVVREAVARLIARYKDAQLVDRLEVRREALQAGDEDPLAVHLPHQMRRDLEEVARRTGYSMSDIVREAIARLLEKWRGRY